MRDLLDFFQRAPLLELGAEADRVRERLHPGDIVTYIVDRNINYTNVCVADCGFCAFYRRPKHNEGWTLSYEDIGRKIDEAKELGAVQILGISWAGVPACRLIDRQPARLPYN